MKILMLTGYAGFTLRTHNICEILSKSTKLKVIKYVYGKENYKWLKNKNNEFYEEIYCIDHILESIEDKIEKKDYEDEIELNYLVKKIELNFTKVLYSERILVQHTHNNIFRRKFNQKQINLFLIKIFNHLEKSLNGVDIVYSYHSSSIFSYLLSEICKIKKIKFITTRHDGITSNLFISYDNSQLLTKKTINTYEQSKINQNSLEIVERYIQNIENGVRSNIITRGQLQKQNNLKINFSNLYRFIKNFFIKHENEMYLQKTNFQRVTEKFNLKFNEYFSKFSFKNEIDTEFKTIYLPLQTSPETGVLRSAVKFYDPLSLIKSLSLYIPPNWKLIVKEHPGMIGKRSYRFYNEIKNIYNVDLLNPNYQSLKLIKNSDAVISISGNTGLESYALGKKTILLGDIFYEVLKGISKINEIDEIYKILINLEEDYTEKNKTMQKNELAKLIFAIKENEHIKNDNDVFWTNETFNKNIISTDQHIANLLIKFLKN